MTIQSKLTPVPLSCITYVHPWTDSCSIATAGLILQAAQDSFRIYSAFYTLSLIMRCRLPTRRDLKRTAVGILQSTAFLTTSAFAYCLFLCVISRTIGSYNFFTFSYIPAFMSSVCALLIERPSRHGLLSLYVSNVATETLFRMAVARGIVRSINYGQVLIFGGSVATILYYFRLGLHTKHKDSIFDLLRFVIGSSEESCAIERMPKSTLNPAVGSIHQINEMHGSNRPTSRRNRLNVIMQAVQFYTILLQRFKSINLKHPSCPHMHSCPYYVVQGGAKLFSVGLGLQILLKCIFQARQLVTHGPKRLGKMLYNRDTLKLGIFLGGFSAVYRGISCLLRHSLGFDAPMFAVPAGLAASISFASYPDITVALYVMWKMLQITYNIGADKGYLPQIPHFTFLLYCASTATLFHAATLEPLCLRQSYWKFLHSLSGGRVAGMDRINLDIYGLDTVNQLAKVMKRTKTNAIIKYTL